MSSSQAGAPARPLDGSAAEPLIPRERDGARLLAQDLSDRQIAGVLVISPLTAGVHVQRILAKLGVRSRWQVAGRYTGSLDDAALPRA